MEFSKNYPPGQMPDPQLIAAAPVNGTDEVQTLTFGGTWGNGDALTLYFGGINDQPGGTASLVYSTVGATMATNLQTALRALLGNANVTVTGTGPFTVTYAAALGKLALPLLRVDVKPSIGTLAVTRATPGVNATLLNAPTGTQCVDQSTGIVYVNTGTPAAPTWTKVGTQT